MLTSMTNATRDESSGFRFLDHATRMTGLRDAWLAELPGAREVHYLQRRTANVCAHQVEFYQGGVLIGRHLGTSEADALAQAFQVLLLEGEEPLAPVTPRIAFIDAAPSGQVVGYYPKT